MTKRKWAPLVLALSVPLLLCTHSFGAERDKPPTGIANPHPPWVIINVSPYGAAALEFHDQTKTLVAFSPAVQLGGRYRIFRGGASLKWLHTWECQSLMEVGGFVSLDAFSVEFDRHRSLAAYIKAEAALRWWLDATPEPTFVMQPFIGLRVLSVYAEAGMGPVFGPPGAANMMGFTMEGRIGLELIEFVSLVKSDGYLQN